jgi:hypothetical protein
MVAKVSLIVLSFLMAVGQVASIPAPRQLLQKAGAAAVAAACTTLLPKMSNALSLDPCPPGSQNCIRVTWTPPKSASKAQIAKTINSVLLNYPQEGQNNVDKGGWTIVEADLDKSGYSRVEYRSGIGMFARFLNGGKPFVDDLQILITPEKKVEIRSSSRVGQSDLGVNQKRLNYLTEAIRASGWEAPDPKY